MPGPGSLSVLLLDLALAICIHFRLLFSPSGSFAVSFLSRALGGAPSGSTPPQDRRFCGQGGQQMGIVPPPCCLFDSIYLGYADSLSFADFVRDVLLRPLRSPSARRGPCRPRPRRVPVRSRCLPSVSSFPARCFLWTFWVYAVVPLCFGRRRVSAFVACSSSGGYSSDFAVTPEWLRLCLRARAFLPFSSSLRADS